MNERFDDLDLSMSIKIYEALGKAASIHQRQMLVALRELQALRRNEYICRRCGIRKDGERLPVEF